jgi:hypothetical protein
MVDHSEFFDFASKIVEAQLRATNEKIAKLAAAVFDRQVPQV